MKKLSLIGLIIFYSLTSSFAQEKQELEVNGFVRNYTGVLFNTGDFSIIQNTLDLTLKHDRDKISFKANPFIYHYPYQDNYFDMRELYMDIYTKKVDFRIGKQQIIWGQADGVFITDIVSPKNLTEFLLWDFSEIRMGVTAFKADYYPHNDHGFEFVYIPSFVSTIAPEASSIWSRNMDFPIQPTFDYSQKNINTNVENGEYFGRYTLTKSAIDLNVMGGYTWDDDPTMHVQKGFGLDSSTNMPVLNSLQIFPKHHRLAVAGISFNTDIKGFIVRGEGAFYKDKYFQTADPKQLESVIQKDYLNYVVGLDKTINDWKFSSQFIQKVIMNYDDYLLNDEVDNLVTLMVNRTMFREKVRLELFSYIGLNNKDAFTRIRGYYFPKDGISLEFGTNLFTGTEGIFGEYDKNDMIYTRIKYNF